MHINIQLFSEKYAQLRENMHFMYSDKCEIKHLRTSNSYELLLLITININ